MKVFTITRDYQGLLDHLHRADSSLSRRPYQEQKHHRDSLFIGVASSYEHHLRKRGIDAFTVYFNNVSMQQAWAAERETSVPRARSDLRLAVERVVRERLRLSPGVRAAIRQVVPPPQSDRRLYEILGKQIDEYRPNVILNLAMETVDADFLAEKKLDQRIHLLVGQIAAPLPRPSQIQSYDLVLTSLPNLARTVAQMGVNSAFLPLAFDARVYESVNPIPFMRRGVPTSFVGSLTSNHSMRDSLLTDLALAGIDLQLWGDGFQPSTANRMLRERYVASAWGLDMYRILSNSRITLNVHIDLAQDFANNLRLFEATGMGALLVTDKKKNLDQYFSIDEEVVTYSNSEEAIDKIHFLNRNPDAAARIAEAGRRRTLTEHNFETVTHSLVQQIEGALRQSR